MGSDFSDQHSSDEDMLLHHLPKNVYIHNDQSNNNTKPTTDDEDNNKNNINQSNMKNNDNNGKRKLSPIRLLLYIFINYILLYIFIIYNNIHFSICLFRRRHRDINMSVTIIQRNLLIEAKVDFSTIKRNQVRLSWKNDAFGKEFFSKKMF